MSAAGFSWTRPLACALVTRATYAALSSASSGETWRRRNYRGRDVSLLGGPALAAAALGAVALDPGVDRRAKVAALVAGGVAALAGGWDDAAGSAAARGLRGHLRALREGRVTTGAAKLAAIGAGGLLGGARVVAAGHGRRFLAGVVIAGTANLVNLLDVRPGRAAKGAVLAAGPIVLAGGPGAAVAGCALGSAGGILPLDLGERAMLGDTGANCLGALVGVALAAGGSARRLAASAAVVVGLTALSEVASYSAIIDATPPLRWLDRLGRADAEGDPVADAEGDPGGDLDGARARA